MLIILRATRIVWGRFVETAYDLMLTFAVIAGLVLASSPGVSHAQSHNPDGVPSDYIITPFGYVHPSCLKQLAPGDTLLQDSLEIRHSNGFSERAPSCGYSRYDSKGKLVSATESALASVNPTNPTPSAPMPVSGNYVVAEGVVTTTSYGQLTANWAVPNAPSTVATNEVLFFFPGLVQANNYNGTILQPVLSFNRDFQSAWGIASWNCCAAGTVFESTAVQVSAGDIVTGTMQFTCPAGTTNCGSWNVTTADLATGQSTTLSQSSSQGQTFNNAYAGTLEEYNVTQCSNYPSNAATAFSNLSLYDYNLALVTPNWAQYNYYSSLSPQCSYGSSVANNGSVVLINYGSLSNSDVPSIGKTCQLGGVSLGGGAYGSFFISNNSGNPIYYTTNGTAPTTASTRYTGQVRFNSATETVNAITAGTGNSPVTSTTFVGTCGTRAS